MSSISRRGALKIGIGGPLATFALYQMFPPALAADSEWKSATPGFISLSSLMLGVSEEKLNPAVSPDGLRLSDLYFNALKMGSNTTSFNAFVAFADEFHASGRADIRDKLSELTARARREPTTASMWGCRMTRMLWLFGIWFGYEESSRMDGSTDDHFSSGYARNYVISSRAYANGWIWKIAQAHPMGVSQFAFGSWSRIPPELTDYGFDVTA